MKQNRGVWLLLASLLSATQATWAVTPVTTQQGPGNVQQGPGNVTKSTPSPANEKQGTINQVDTANQSIVVDHVTYLLPVKDLIVHTTDPSRVPARLRKGTNIRFKIEQNPTEDRPKITEIWFIEGE